MLYYTLNLFQFGVNKQSMKTFVFITVKLYRLFNFMNYEFVLFCNQQNKLNDSI